MELLSKRSTDVPAFGLLQNLARGTCALQWGSRLIQVYASDWRKSAYLPPVESSSSRSNGIRAKALPSPGGPHDVMWVSGKKLTNAEGCHSFTEARTGTICVIAHAD